jgi:hypothetical protein
MKAVANRRQHPRRTALFSAKFTVKSGTYRDLVKNVSAGGIFIGSRRMIEHGQRISLRFPVMAFDSKPIQTDRSILYLTDTTGHGALRMTYWALEPKTIFPTLDLLRIPITISSIS